MNFSHLYLNPHKSVCVCVCLSVQFFNPLPIVQCQIQAQFWNPCATAVKIKLFAVPLKQKQKKICMKIFHWSKFFCSIQIHIEWNVSPKQFCLLYTNSYKVKCLSQTNICTRRASMGGRRPPKCEFLNNSSNIFWVLRMHTGAGKMLEPLMKTS